MISKVTTKTGAVVLHDLKLCPLTLDQLQHVPARQRVGALIIDEHSGRPYAAHAYARERRVIARKAGIPDTLRGAMGQSWTVAVQRVAHRMKKEQSWGTIWGTIWGTWGTRVQRQTGNQL